MLRFGRSASRNRDCSKGRGAYVVAPVIVSRALSHDELRVSLIPLDELFALDPASTISYRSLTDIPARLAYL